MIMKTKLENITVKHYIPNGSENGQEILCIHKSPELALAAIGGGGQKEDDDMMSTTCWHYAAKKSDVTRLKYDGEGNAVTLED
jgi:hypothetical protein